MYVSARTTMRGAAKCDEHCVLQDSVNESFSLFLKASLFQCLLIVLGCVPRLHTSVFLMLQCSIGYIDACVSCFGMRNVEHPLRKRCYVLTKPPGCEFFSVQRHDVKPENLLNLSTKVSGSKETKQQSDRVCEVFGRKPCKRKRKWMLGNGAVATVILKIAGFSISQAPLRNLLEILTSCLFCSSEVGPAGQSVLEDAGISETAWTQGFLEPSRRHQETGCRTQRKTRVCPTKRPQ